jgi:hypothetical protein
MIMKYYFVGDATGSAGRDGTAARLGTGRSDPGFEFWQGQNVFFSSNTSRQGVGTHPASCSMDTTVLSASTAAGGVQLTPPSRFKVKNGVIPLLTPYAFVRCTGTIVLLLLNIGAPGGGGCSPAAPPPVRVIFKRLDFVDTIISKLKMIFVSAEVSHCNRLMTSTLEY